MCGGALMWSQIDHVVYGASDKEKGCFSKAQHQLPKKTKIEGGILAVPCGEILYTFFKEKRF
jgi:tRNA(adenine34) deaminase